MRIIYCILSIIICSGISSANDGFKLEGKSYEYKVSGYHICMNFIDEKKLKWTYIDAPGKKDRGKTAVEIYKKQKINNNIFKLKWTEKNGAKIMDIFDFDKMTLNASSTMPDGKEYNSKTTITSRDDCSYKNQFSMKEIEFKSGENILKGIVFTPNSAKKKYPAVTILGPVGYVKEQAPLKYAKALATKGYKTVIFDATYHGESAGLPRRFESGSQKTKDVMASVDFLKNLEDVDKENIYALGICQGVNWVIDAVNEKKSIKGTALVAGHYLKPEVAEKYVGGKDNVELRLKKAKQAKTKYETTGEIEYIPVVSLTDKNALLLAKPVYDWYIPWENNSDKGGKWENRITRMSELDIWGGNVEPKLKKMEKPLIMIHSNRAATGTAIPKKLYDIIPSKNKDLKWFEDQTQMQFYEDDVVIERAVDAITTKFNSLL